MNYIKPFEQFLNEQSRYFLNIMTFPFSKGDVFELDIFKNTKPRETGSKYPDWDFSSKVKPYWHQYPDINYDHAGLTMKVLDFKPLDKRKDVGTKRYLKELELPGKYTCFLRKVEIIKPSKVNLTIKAIGAIEIPMDYFGSAGVAHFVYGTFTGKVHRNVLGAFLERSSEFRSKAVD